MKAILITSLLFAGTLAHAKVEEVEIERSRNVVKLEVALNSSTVRCLKGDYGSDSLKISMHELRAYTVFPQTTAGETAPCINAGSCSFGSTPDGRRLDPSLILDPSKPTEVVSVTIVLKELLSIDHAEKTCQRSLREDVTSTVRGLDFAHSDGIFLGKLDYSACMKLRL